MKMKKTVIVEAEVSGPELWAELREKAEAKVEQKFLIGDIVDATAAQNRFNDGDYLREVIILDYTRHDDAYEIGYFDEDGDYMEDTWVDSDKLLLVNRFFNQGAVVNAPPVRSETSDFTGRSKNPGL